MYESGVILKQLADKVQFWTNNLLLKLFWKFDTVLTIDNRDYVTGIGNDDVIVLYYNAHGRGTIRLVKSVLR